MDAGLPIAASLKASRTARGRLARPTSTDAATPAAVSSGIPLRGTDVDALRWARGGRTMVGKRSEETSMDEDAFNMSVRKFLKKLGVTAQRDIELAVREQLAAGELRGDERLGATATITVSGLGRDILVTGTIALS
jgi:Family of unknown function (DUF6494)